MKVYYRDGDEQGMLLVVQDDIDPTKLHIRVESEDGRGLAVLLRRDKTAHIIGALAQAGNMSVKTSVQTRGERKPEKEA